MSNKITRDQMEIYLREVGGEIDARGMLGEILIVGGAYMTLVLSARVSTKDVDAVIGGDPNAVRSAAAIVARRHGLPDDWINDAAKGFLYRTPKTTLWAQYPGLRIYMPTPDYIFAMKATAARPGDFADLITLKSVLALSSFDEAARIVDRYTPASRIRPQTQFMLEALFEKGPRNE